MGNPLGWLLQPSLPHLVQAKLPAREGEGETQWEALPTQAVLLLEVQDAVHDVVKELRSGQVSVVVMGTPCPSLPQLRPRLWVPAVQSPEPHTQGWSRPGW